MSTFEYHWFEYYFGDYRFRISFDRDLDDFLEFDPEEDIVQKDINGNFVPLMKTPSTELVEVCRKLYRMRINMIPRPTCNIHENTMD